MTKLHTMVNIFPTTGREGQEEDFPVQAPEPTFPRLESSSTIHHQLDWSEDIIALNIGDNLVHHSVGKRNMS